MKSSNSIKYFFLLLAMLVMSIAVFSQNPPLPARPNPPRLVNDLAGVLQPEQRDELERKLVALDDSTSNQIAIVLIKTLNDYPIEDYSVNLFRSWGIGNKKTNNGVLVVAAMDDHKVRIEVGYGLEGAIPDITANDIIYNDITPNFKTGNYFRGLDIATDDLSKAAAGEYHTARKKDTNNDEDGGGGSILGIIIIVIIILIIIRSGRGGRGGGMISRRGYGGLGPLFWASMLGSGSRSWGSDSGGWSGGGGGGGGGFGGFGGGSSGGGGASGSW